MRRRVLVLGSTGSVGRQTLDVLAGLSRTHEVVGLGARRSAKLLAAQAAAFRPSTVALADADAAAGLALPAGSRCLTGPYALTELVAATRPDVVVCAVSGAAGLRSTLAAAEQGCVLGLANKESLVLAGHLLKAATARSGGTIVPVDSEHCAIAQCLVGSRPEEVRRIILTASGGPFRGRQRAELAAVTPEQALRHPSWNMGPRITVDSATLMNKALEIIEACQLFDCPPERVAVVVHPQSVVHSMVEFIDGALLAQLSPPDMRVPIRWALGWPERLSDGSEPLDLARLGTLTFEEPDRPNFPCLDFGARVATAGGLAGTVLNAANEVAVEAFLAGRLPFLAIADVVAAALDAFAGESAPDLASIEAADREVRRATVARLPRASGALRT